MPHEAAPTTSGSPPRNTEPAEPAQPATSGPSASRTEPPAPRTEPVSVSLQTADGVSLAASWFAPPGGAPHTSLLLNSGTGIPRGFYRRFAHFAAQQGFGVLTFDYRGIGGSAPARLAGSNITYRAWGQRDIPAAIAWLRDRHPEVPLVVVAHSAGGQQLGLAHNVQAIDAALFIAVSTGYWRGMPTRQKWFTWALWNLIVPTTRLTLGYFPARRLGLGEDLPAGVAREWGAWCLEPAYMAAFFDESGHRRSPDGQPFGPVHFADARFPITAFCFSDDEIATADNVPPMLQLFSGTQPEVRWLQPQDVGAEAIGHLGFFREGIAGALWGPALADLRAAALAHRAGH